MTTPGIKLHPRRNTVYAAGVEFRKWMLEFEHRHGLTGSEVVQMLAAEINTHMKYAIRVERHGDASKKGDEA